MKQLLFMLCAALMAVVVYSSGPVFAQTSPTPTATPVLAAMAAIVLRDANLRAGPGTTFAIAGHAKTGDKFNIVGANAAGDWYQVDEGKWIASFLVSIDSLPTKEATPTVLIPDDMALSSSYLTELANIVTNYKAAFATFGAQMGAAGKDTSLIFDDDWRLKTATALALIRTTGKDVRSLTPPQGFQDIHSDLLLAANHYDKAVDLTIDGLDHANADSLIAAVAEMQLGNKAVESANTKTKIVSLVTPTRTPAPIPTVTPVIKLIVSSPTPTPTKPTSPPTPTPTIDNCDPSYPGACIPPPPPDLDCGDITYRRFQVVGADPHRFDSDHDGVGCEVD